MIRSKRSYMEFMQIINLRKSQFWLFEALWMGNNLRVLHVAYILFTCWQSIRHLFPAIYSRMDSNCLITINTPYPWPLITVYPSQYKLCNNMALIQYQCAHFFVNLGLKRLSMPPSNILNNPEQFLMLNWAGRYNICHVIHHQV